ncbi:MAG TPA: hypothetical protein VFP93_03685 [Gammaproteobacteria bacterium]|nr:hypothetical protein [Gammaproteobacteria bacterium]
MKKQVKTESTAKTKRAFARLLSNELPMEILSDISGGKWSCKGTVNEKHVAVDCGNYS